MFPQKVTAAFWIAWCSLLVLIIAGVYWWRRDPTEKFANTTLQMMSLPSTNLFCAEDRTRLKARILEINQYGVAYVEETYNDQNRKVVVNGNTPEAYRQKPPLKQVN